MSGNKVTRFSIICSSSNSCSVVPSPAEDSTAPEVTTMIAQWNDVCKSNNTLLSSREIDFCSNVRIVSDPMHHVIIDKELP